MTPLLEYHPQSNEANILDTLEEHYVDYPDSVKWDDIPSIELYLLGCGYFSSVWKIHGDPFKVMKVSHRPSDGCRQYMQWAMANPHPNAPIIHEIRFSGDYMVAIMERLYPCCHTDDVPGSNVLVNGARPKHSLGHEQLCATIRRVFKGMKFDLHSGNVMQRRDGTIVITDPVSFSKEDAYGSDECEGCYT